MSPGCCFRVLGVPRVWIRFREGSLGLINDKDYYTCVVIRTLVRLGEEDRACGYVASKISELQGKRTAPVLMVMNGTKCSRGLSCVIVGIMPRDTFKRSKSTVHDS